MTGPENLYIGEADSVALNQDNEQFAGHDKEGRALRIKESGGGTDGGYRRLSSNQEVSFEVQDNQSGNGNCWIGRPLIAGDYYIKELSRSEGYELSVYGKNASVTNKDAMEHGGEAVEGSVTLKGWTENEQYTGNLLTAESREIGEQGYDIYLYGMPEECPSPGQHLRDGEKRGNHELREAYLVGEKSEGCGRKPGHD